MEYLRNGYTLDIPTGCFPLSTDSILLADFIRLPRNAQVLDLGSGWGTLGLLLCARDDTCHVTGVEIDPTAHRAAIQNIENNQLQSRLFSICNDLRTIPMGTYSVCVSNPPYYTGGPANSRTPQARRDDCCSLPELFIAAAHSLRHGGDFFLVHKPERLAELCTCGNRCGLEPKRLRLIRHREGGEVSLILLSFRKGGKPGLVWEERTLHHCDGTPTAYYKELYHLEEVDHGRNAISRPHSHR